MTNEEAKSHIRVLLERGGSDGFDYKEEEALNLAIKALEQTDKVEESNFNLEQYEETYNEAYKKGYYDAMKGAYECGYNSGYTDALEQTDILDEIEGWR